MTAIDEDEKKRKEDILKLFKEFKTETEKRQVSSSENFDKSILTYASWALGVSIAFLKDFIPITDANYPFFLYASWILFAYAIASTTSSFLISYKGLEQSLQDGAKYYLEEDESYFDKENKYNKCVKYLNQTSGLGFILGLVFTLVFVITNLEKSAMLKQSSSRPTYSDQDKVVKGLPSPSMQKIPPATSRPTPATTPTTTPSSNTSNNQNTNR